MERSLLFVEIKPTNSIDANSITHNTEDENSVYTVMIDGPRVGQYNDLRGYRLW